MEGKVRYTVCFDYSAMDALYYVGNFVLVMFVVLERAIRDCNGDIYDFVRCRLYSRGLVTTYVVTGHSNYIIYGVQVVGLPALRYRMEYIFGQ